MCGSKIFLFCLVVINEVKNLWSLYIFITISLILISPVMLFMVNAQENTIPSWIKNTVKFWVDEQVTDIEFINALEYMINNKIIKNFIV